VSNASTDNAVAVFAQGSQASAAQEPEAEAVALTQQAALAADSNSSTAALAGHAFSSS